MPKVWTREQMACYAALHGLANATPEEMERMAMLATKVAQVAADVPRMPSKGSEPASIFKVPL
jgi:hypothetical protein